MGEKRDQCNVRTLCRGLAAEGVDEIAEVICLEEIDSTNLEAKRRILGGSTRFSLVVANRQTAGKGRMGRTFYSPEGSGVYCTLAYPVEAPMERAVSVTGAAAVAVMRAIRRLTGIQTEIKWVNDLYLNGKKVCGILAESITLPDDPTRRFMILGIGVNWYRATFPEELDSIAGSVGAEGVDRATLISGICRELLPFLLHAEDRSWLEDYRRHSCVIGKRVRWSCGDVAAEGSAVDVDGDGALLVRTEDGDTLRLRTGEISLRVVE